MNDYPKTLTTVGQVEPVPRRIRARLGGQIVVDTIRAVYRWDIPYFPHYYIPLDDFDERFVHVSTSDGSEASWNGDLAVQGERRPGALTVRSSLGHDHPGAYATVEWSAVDAWFEEDEEVFTHARDPYHRVDALRSRRALTIELDGVTLAHSASPVMVFETGLPTRYYVDPTDVDWSHLIASSTRTSCAYKGMTSGYWSITTPSGTHPDLAWSYNFPTAAVRPLAGLIAFYNEKVDIRLDGRLLERPSTQFS